MRPAVEFEIPGGGIKCQVGWGRHGKMRHLWGEMAHLRLRKWICIFLQGEWVNMAMSEGNLRTFDEKLDGEDASFDERRWTVVGKMTSFIEGFEMVTLTGK
jgi:hypothetical protein